MSFLRPLAISSFLNLWRGSWRGDREGGGHVAELLFAQVAFEKREVIHVKYFSYFWLYVICIRGDELSLNLMSAKIWGAHVKNTNHLLLEVLVSLCAIPQPSDSRRVLLCILLVHSLLSGIESSEDGLQPESWVFSNLSGVVSVRFDKLQKSFSYILTN